MQSEPRPPALSDHSRHAPAFGGAVLGLIGLCCGVELLLVAVDNGWIGSTRWRALAYQHGAFWAGLLYDWRPNYTAQPWVMFLSYAFLHAGFGHLAGNMLTLAFLGPLVRQRFGGFGFLAVYFLSAIGGAAGFAVIGNTVQPMVGASGALFGLAGAVLCSDWSRRARAGQSLWPVQRMIAMLVLLNVVMWWWLDGVLAWQTHLAGFVAGWIVAVGLAKWRPK